MVDKYRQRTQCLRLYGDCLGHVRGVGSCLGEGRRAAIARRHALAGTCAACLRMAAGTQVRHVAPWPGL